MPSNNNSAPTVDNQELVTHGPVLALFVDIESFWTADSRRKLQIFEKLTFLENYSLGKSKSSCSIKNTRHKKFMIYALCMKLCYCHCSKTACHWPLLGQI